MTVPPRVRAVPPMRSTSASLMQSPPGGGRRRRFGSGLGGCMVASIGCSLFWGRFAVTKPLSKKHRNTFLPLQGADSTPSFGGFGLNESRSSPTSRGQEMESRHFKWTGSLWPTTLRLPARPPRLIYLDLNHWIELSKAHSGHRDGKKHRCVLDACLKAVRDGKAVFPLSEHIYAEIAKINSYRQRRDLQEIIEQVCRYMVVTSLTVVATHEIEAVLDQTVGPSPVPLNTTNYLDWGVSRAFGRTGDIRIKSASGDDVTEEFRRTYPSGTEAFDTVLLNAERELSRRAIEGPTLQEEPGLRAGVPRPSCKRINRRPRKN